MLVRANYTNIRARIRPCDIIGFNGRGPISWAIRTGSGIPTHLALVATPLHARQHRVELIESTSLKLPGMRRKIGVQRTYLSDRLRDYKGEIWWFPLSDWASQLSSQPILENILSKYLGASYDFWQVIREGWSCVLPHLFPVRESAKYLYCSELVAFVLQDLGILPEEINASVVSPSELIRMNVFSGTYYQLTGKYKLVPGYNTLDVLTEVKA